MNREPLHSKIIQDIIDKAFEEGRCPVHDGDLTPEQIKTALETFVSTIPAEYEVRCVCGIVLKERGE